MIHPTPPGTRDVLPDEMRELRAISDALRATFEAHDYGEVWTPTMEYEDVLRRGDEQAAGAGYRLFDDHGQLLALRSDMTIPIARVVGTRYQDAEPPIRLAYFAHAYRAVTRGEAQTREFLQAGIELVGSPAPEGDAEVVAITLEALERVGLRRCRIAIGDGELYRSLLGAYEVGEGDRRAVLEALSGRDLVGLGTSLARAGLSGEAEAVLSKLCTLRGGPEVLEGHDGPAATALEGLRRTHELLAERGVADSVILDLGLVRELGYYTGSVFEVYDPAVGRALGGGGRYDDLVGRFGRDLPACGIALDLHRVHLAQTAEERLG